MIGIHARLANGSPDFRVDWGNWRDAVEQGSEIQSCPADKDWQPAARLDAFDFAARHDRPIRGRAGLGAVERAVKPMLGTSELIDGRAGAEDSEVAIDLRAVGID